MRLSENRAIAWLVFAACVVFSLSFSSGRALSNLRADNERVFFSGTAQSMGLSIDKHLSTRAGCAYNIASVAGNYPIDKALTANAKDAADQLSSAGTIEEKNAANLACERAVQDLYTAIDNAALSATDRNYALSQYRDFQAAGDLIRHDKYNEYATDFNQELSAFPARLLANMTGVKPLTLFSS